MLSLLAATYLSRVANFILYYSTEIKQLMEEPEHLFCNPPGLPTVKLSLTQHRHASLPSHTLL